MGLVALAHSYGSASSAVNKPVSQYELLGVVVGKSDWWWSDCGRTGSDWHSSGGLESHSAKPVQGSGPDRLEKLMNEFLGCVGMAGMHLPMFLSVSAFSCLICVQSVHI